MGDETDPSGQMPTVLELGAIANGRDDRRGGFWADDGSAATEHALAGTMQSLDVLLLNGLLRHQRDVCLARSSADRLGVIAVILLPTHEELHILACRRIL